MKKLSPFFCLIIFFSIKKLLPKRLAKTKNTTLRTAMISGGSWSKGLQTVIQRSFLDWCCFYILFSPVLFCSSQVFLDVFLVRRCVRMCVRVCTHLRGTRICTPCVRVCTLYVRACSCWCVCPCVLVHMTLCTCILWKMYIICVYHEQKCYTCNLSNKSRILWHDIFILSHE